jgi:hypothetical protein
LALDSAPRKLARDQHEDLKELAAKKAAPAVHNITKDVLHRIAEAGILKDWEYRGLVDALFPPKEDGATDEGGEMAEVEKLLRARGLGDDDIEEFQKLVEDTLPSNAIEAGPGGKFAEERKSMGMDAGERSFFRDFPDAARITPEAPLERRPVRGDAASIDELARMFPGIERIGFV